jgi:hypothetical protein
VPPALADVLTGRAQVRWIPPAGINVLEGLAAISLSLLNVGNRPSMMSPLLEVQLPRFAQHEHFRLRPELPVRAVAKILELGRLEARQTMAANLVVPPQILVHREPVAFAGFGKTEEAPAYCCDHFSLTPDDPAPRFWGRKICNR